MKKFIWKIDLLFCCILSIAITSSPYLLNTGGWGFSAGWVLTFLYIYVGLLLLFALSRLCITRISIFTKNPNCLNWYKNILDNKRAKFYLMLLIFLAWLMPLILLYPGTFINDTWDQIRRFIRFFIEGTGGITDYHPFFDTIFMGVLIVPFAKMTGLWNFSTFLYVLIQALLTSYMLANTIHYAYKKLHLTPTVLFIVLITYCFLPIYPAAVQTVSKDALHSWVYVGFLLLFIEIIRTKGESLKEKRFFIQFVFSVFLSCLTKKVAFYVLFLSLVSLFILFKTSRKKISFILISIFISMKIIIPAFIIQGGKQEMLSLPFQMTARTVKYHKDGISPEEAKIIDKVLDYDELETTYNPYNSDPVKKYSQKGSDSDYVDYMKVWLNQGIKYPGTYALATANMLAGWFSFHEYKPLMNSYWRSQIDTNYIPEWVNVRTLSESTAVGYQNMYDNLYRIPLFSIVLSYGFYSLLIPVFVFISLIRFKGNQYWLVMLPNILSIVLGCWCGPLSTHFEGVRYLYPVLYTTPLMLMWLIYSYKINKQQC